MALEQTFMMLKDIGIFDVFLPFVLIFTIVFAVLQKIKLFDDKRVNTMIALVMGLATIAPHVLMGTPAPDSVLSNGLPDVVEIINGAIPGVSVVVVAILMALIVIGVMGKRVELGDSSLSGWIALISFAVVIVIFLAAAGVFKHPTLNRTISANPDLVALVVVILVFAIVIWFITKDDGDQTKMSKEKFGEKFAGLLQGGGHH